MNDSARLDALYAQHILLMSEQYDLRKKYEAAIAERDQAREIARDAFADATRAAVVDAFVDHQTDKIVALEALASYQREQIAALTSERDAAIAALSEHRARVIKLEGEVDTERKCRLANEEELHRADKLLGDTRAQRDTAWRELDARRDKIGALEAERDAAISRSVKAESDRDYWFEEWQKEVLACERKNVALRGAAATIEQAEKRITELEGAIQAYLRARHSHRLGNVDASFVAQRISDLQVIGDE